MSDRPRFNDAPCGLILVDRDDLILDINRTLMNWVGAEVGSLKGSPFVEMLTPSSSIFYETRWKQSLALQGELREASLSLRGEEGGDLPMLANARLDSRGRTYAALFDARGRLDYERGLTLARREAIAAADRVRTLQEAGEAFSRISSEDELVDELAERARKAFAASSAVVVLLDEHGQLTQGGGTSHPLGPDWLREYRVPATGTVMIENLDDVPLDPALVEGFRSQRIEAVTSTEISHAGQQLGRLLCFYGRPRRRREEALDLQVALGRLAGDVIVRLRLQRELEQMAYFDALTGLPNRSSVLREISSAMDGDDDEPLSLIFIDLDAFKLVNDRHGHAVGDAVLRESADRIKAAVRSEDLVGRLGGDEFIVLAKGADTAAVIEIGERIREALHAPSELPLVTASLGAATARTGMRFDSSEDLVNRADEAMYRAKETGKDRVELHDE